MPYAHSNKNVAPPQLKPFPNINYDRIWNNYLGREDLWLDWKIDGETELIHEHNTANSKFELKKFSDLFIKY